MIRKYGLGGSASFSGTIARPRGYSPDGTTFFAGGSGPIRRIRTSKLACLAVLGLFALPLHLFSQPGKESYRYAVVMKTAAYQDAGWKAVADTLLAMHGKTASKLFQWNSDVAEVKSALAQFAPDYIAYVCRPATDANSALVGTLLTFNRELDPDPYFDAVWSIVTGYAPEDAIRAAKSKVRCKTGVTGPDGTALRTRQGVVFPVDPPKVFYFFPDGRMLETSDPDLVGSDRIVPLCKWLNEGIHIEKSGYPAIDGPVDLFMTGGHGSTNNWQAHFPVPDGEGFLKSSDGKLFGDPASGNDIPINKTTPTVYFAVNNCLIGNPDNPGNLVYAWFHTGGATHMFGFIVSTWASHAGYAAYCRMSDKVNPPEAYFLGMNNIVFICEKNIVFDEWNKSEYEFNLESTIMYGDPRGDAYFDTSFSLYTKDVENTLTRIQTVSGQPDTFVFTSTWNTDKYEAYEWWQRDLRPVMFLPVRIDPATVAIVKNDLYNQVICDNMLIADPWRYGDCKIGAKKNLVWTAKAVDYSTPVFFANSVATSGLEFHAVYSMNTNTVSMRFNLSTTDAVELAIVNSAGREVMRKRHLPSSRTHAGRRVVTFDLSGGGRSLSSGVYHALLRSGGAVAHDAFVYMR